MNDADPTGAGSPASVAFLDNPTARHGAHTGAARRAALLLRGAGIDVRALPARTPGEASALLTDAVGRGAEAVVVAGGDGTVGLAVQVLAGTGIPLGIIPTGTGNDLATGLGLRELDADGAAAAVIGGRVREIDLARLTRADGTSTLFGTVLASGFDSKVNDRANRMPWPRGHVRYDIAILAEFLRLRADPFRIELELADGRVEVVDDTLTLTAIGNGRTYGGGIPICPVADLADGLLDATIVRRVSRPRLLRLLPRVYRGTHPTIPEVSTYRIRSARLVASGVTAYADGEPQGPLPVHVAAVPGALRVFAP
ncbi:diacylglycerol kinase [Microbacterium sp. W1N]|uniref:diacylglycerol kinase n=1 Tax=Microbacterium festucae TaxID=2977531 RepID=UPI0021BEF2D5|nr:diacylglycerol kinase [Microbacterium festucae]MCT9818708.1 diacylglycerol kinase [Microbacterium festucae]